MALPRATISFSSLAERHGAPSPLAALSFRVGAQQSGDIYRFETSRGMFERHGDMHRPGAKSPCNQPVSHAADPRPDARFDSRFDPRISLESRNPETFR